jgi:putative glycosyltransferase (TIGR04372 family)
MYSRVLKRAGFELANRIREKKWSAIALMVAKVLIKVIRFLILPLGLVVALIIRAIRPWLLVRINILSSERLGHFAANPELYLCERDAGINRPTARYFDLWYHNWPICNRQLAKMWSRVLNIGPAWLLGPTARVISLIPGAHVHCIPDNTQSDRDVLNLLEGTATHLHFLPNEEKNGREGLRKIGIPENAPFVCLNVRDNVYLRGSIPWTPWGHHDYRNCNIQNYVNAATELTKRGYYVVRMGAAVKESMKVKNSMIIDYAMNGMRTDFMDIYLGANCSFCISNGTGFDAIPYVLRRPIAYVDHVPIGIINSFSPKCIVTTKKHWLRKESRFMTLREILDSGAAYFFWSSDYEELGIDLIESTPDDIVAVAVEMDLRLKGCWVDTEGDEELQMRFWEILLESVKSNRSKALVGMTSNYTKPFHGQIRSRFGAEFLRANRGWLE